MMDQLSFMKTFLKPGGTVSFAAFTIDNGAGEQANALFGVQTNGARLSKLRVLKLCKSDRSHVGGTSRIQCGAGSFC